MKIQAFSRTSAVAAGILFTAAMFAMPAFAGSWQQNVSVGGFNKVHLYSPDSVSAIGQGRGLLVVLHGCTQSIDAYLNANLTAAAEQFGLVIAVPDAMNKAGFGCWSYWQGTKARSAGDYKNLITLANNLVADVNLQIDPNQVYIAGLSSGAAFANTTACLAPDVFAGMGISAGPSIGTSSSGAIGPCETANVASRCAQYAGSYASHFDTQIASIAHGRSDTTVNLCYNEQNANGMADLYNVSQLSGENLISEGSSRTADETLWQDGRVSMLWFNNVDHAWSGGQGASGSYINGNSINYAVYLGQYFLDNNQRVNRNSAPGLTNINVSQQASVVTVTGNAADIDGDAITVSASFTDSIGQQQLVSTTPAATGNFSLSSPALNDDWYQLSVTATDSGGLVSTPYTEQLLIGPPPPAAAPELSELVVAVDGQCAVVSGRVFDLNRDLASVTVEFASATVTASINDDLFSAQRCQLAGGEQTALITATDQGGLFSAEQLIFTIDAGQNATLDQHISAGRLDYTNYANCYLEYGTASFVLREQVITGSQCRWQDNDASCFGPAQSCSAAGPGDDGSDGGDDDNPPPPPPPADCVAFTTNNYSHKVAGRAYSTGNIYAPAYFANGSNAAMAGSTWGITTLSSADDSFWQPGGCPQ
ncbi:PHB depolymerase family esterase [Arsukibacterium sp.]|uniref:extracellular catalytic domain type 1 short-chain-length polyhydroxyalkanoate depolymerase n=1 Tax=Arsukibacterium sp. TaxID=1977258 RepID=UPI00299EB70A|nr:PHB depolymerase family esterase [Arsukibacterium sp.]MDX1539143.1 PHB depolymerase family esterase [Arsukibacterium sp.]